MRKMFLAGASLLVLSAITPAFTNDTDKVVSATGNLLIDTVNKKGIFQWVEGQFSHTSNRLEYGLTGFSVLGENKNRLQYLQTSIHRKGGVNALNLGVGTRRLTQLLNSPALVGVNLFIDTKDGENKFWRLGNKQVFRRLSLGLELKTGVFDFSANYYNPLGNAVIQDQKVLKGFDITASGNVPNLESLTIGLNTYRFDGVGDTVDQGNKLIAEFRPNSILTLRAEYDKPRSGEANTELFTGLKWSFNTPLAQQLKPLNISGDAWAKRYDKVERHYDIKTAEVDSTPALGSTLSAAEKTANKISDGDGTTEQSAYALQNSEQYDVADFVGDIPDTLKTTGGVIDANKVTVKVEQVDGDGEKGTDYELYASDGSVISLSEITADSKFTDIAGGKAATLKLTYSADGFEDRVVFVKAIAISQIGTVLSDSDKTSNDIKGGDGSSEANAYTLTNTKTYDLSTFIGTLPTGVTPTVKAERVSGTSGTDFQFKNGSTNVAIGSATYSSTLEDKAGAGAAVIKLTYSATDFNPRIVYVKTDIAFTGSLTMTNLVVPYASGNVTVSTAQILGKLSVTGSQTQKSDWTVKSLADTDSHGNLTVNGKTLVISGAIPSGTTVTAVFEHTGSEYADQTKTFELSTGEGTLGDTPTGLSGKWGKTFNVDYKLKSSDTVGDVTVSFDTGTDFTFTIVPSGDGGQGGKDATTAGIVTGALSGAIDDKTGAIDGSKLNKSGKLLVKIVRAAKGGLPELTVYENITVNKQESSDHSGFTVSAGAIPWATASRAITYTPTNLPTGIGTATYTLTATGTTAGPTTGGNAITIASSTGAIAKTNKSGVVKVRITYAANDKYTSMTRDVDVTINKQTLSAGTLSVANLVVSYVSGNKTVSAADVLGQLTTTGSNRSDWTVKSLTDTDGHANVAAASGGKSLTISGAITTSTTITVVFESTKYTDVTKTFELSTRPAQVIDGTPTGLTGKWGKGSVTPDYKLKTRDQGQDFDKANDFTFVIVPASDGGKGGKDATTAGIVTGALTGAINEETGVIDTSKLTQSGKLLIQIVRDEKGTGANKVAEATDYVNFDVTKQVLGTDVTTPPAVAKATSESGKWKDSTVTKIDLDYTLPGGTRATQYTWTVAKKSSDAPSGTLNIVNGDIRGATSGGTVEITMTATPGNPKYSGSMRTADFTIAKQVLGTDVTTRPAVATASGEDGKWKSSTSAKIALNYTLPGGTTASQYSWAVGKKSGDAPSGTLVIDQTNGHISGAASSGTAEITITAKAANKKYSGSIRTADFAIAKQTVAASTLSVANLVVTYTSGTRTVSAADVLGQLTATGSSRSDWTVKSLADTDSHANVAVASGGKSLTISGGITTATTTITVVFESSKYNDVSKDFELSTRASDLTTATPTGTGVWGKTYTPTYNLDDKGGTFKTGTGGDFTFSIEPSGTTVSGLTSTTNGIVASGQNAITPATGAIDATKLTRSGVLLIKIVRAKSGTTTVTEHYNLTVGKQVLGTHVTTIPTVSLTGGDNNKWKSNTATKFRMTYANLPGTQAANTFDWIVAGKTGNVPSGTLDIDTNGRISGATSAGTAIITMKAKTNDPKYSGQFILADFAIAKQAGTGALTMDALVIPYASGSEKVATATITGKLGVPAAGGLGAKSEWTLKSLADTDSHSNLAVTDSGKTLTISGAITTSTTVTATFESDKYDDKTATFELSTGAGEMTDTSATRSGLRGKWGVGFTTAADYKLKLSDTVGDTTVTFTKGTTSTPGDYTFTIVPTSDGGKGGKDATTSGIVTGTLTGAINANTGAIDGSKLNKSGKVLVKIVRKAKGGLPALTDYENITVDRQVLGTDVTTIPTIRLNSGDNKWKTGNTKFDLKYTNLPGGLSASAFGWGIKSTTASGLLAIDAVGKINGATSAGTVVITMTASASNNDKYVGSFDLAAFTIAKQTTTDTLSMADLVISYVSADGDRKVTTAEILGQLSVSSTGTAQTQKSEWTLVSVADTDNNGDLAVTDSGKTLTISDEITTKTTVTATLSHPAYENKTATFGLSTERSKISKGPRTGSGKWGKTYTTNYNIKSPVGGQTFKISDSDFTFSIVASGTNVAGYTSTTPNIFSSNPITASTGVIDGTKLTKSGTLLVKIDRKAKGSVKKVTEYQNFTVSKQDSSDHTRFSISAGTIRWNANSQTVTYIENARKPAGISTSPTYALIASGTTAGTTSGNGAITVSSDGKIANTSKSGVVKVKVTYPANDKYAEITRDVSVPVNKQTGTGALTMGDLVIPFGAADTSKPVSTATITGKLGVPSAGGLGAKSEWTLTDLSKKDANTNITLADDDKSLTITGAFTTSTRVTATFESEKYATRFVDFKLSTGAGVMSTGTRDGLSGKWGKTFAVDYKLKGSDTVGDVQNVTFTTGSASTASDYTFTIVTGNKPSDAPSSAKATTSNILDTSKTAINAKNGVINGMALTKSGDLLVKIVRKAKGGLPELIEYENITVTKQDSNDHTGFTVSAAAIPWATASQTVTYTSQNKPTGISSPSYALIRAGTTAGTSGGLGSIQINSTGAIAKTVQSGVVKVEILYAANDKYERITRNVDVKVNKQAGSGDLTMATLVVPYSGTGTKDVTGTDVKGKLSVPNGLGTQSDWTLKSLAKRTGAVADDTLEISGDKKSMTIKKAISTATPLTAVFESSKYTDRTVNFTMSTAGGTLSGTPTGLVGTWGKSFNVDYDLKTTDTVGGVTATFTTGSSGDFTFSIVAAGGNDGSGLRPTTANIFTTSPINTKTGAITGANLLKSGTLLVKIVRAAKTVGSDTVPQLIGYENITVNKQVFGTGTNADIKKVPTITLISDDSGTEDKKWKSDPDTKFNIGYTDLPGRQAVNTFVWSVANKQNAGPSGTVKIDQADGQISGATSAGTVVITVKAKASDPKYTGQFDLADFVIGKQTATDTLSMGNFVIPYVTGAQVVSNATLRGKFAVAKAQAATNPQTQKSDWTIKSLSGLGANASVVTDAQGKNTIRISGAISSAVTVTATFESPKYADKTATFTLKTGSGTLLGTPTRTAGKWGKAFNVDYDLKTSDTVGDVGPVTFKDDGTTDDFAFTIEPHTSAAPSGLKPTTQGIVSGLFSGAIDGKTGAITGSKLIKSGDLLVKIVRKAKGGLPALTGYVNITVNKQTDADHSGFTVTPSGITWNANSQTVTYATANTPPGISTPTYTLTALGTTAGPTSGNDAITVTQNNGHIAKTSRGGVVKVKVTYAANDKYAEIVKNVDVAVDRKTETGTLSIADIVKPYGGGTVTISSSDIEDKISVASGISTKDDWTIKSLTETHDKLAAANGALTISGAIATPTTVTAVLESTKYKDKTGITFKVSTDTGTMSTGTARSGLSGKWGKGFTTATDYQLKLTDTVGSSSYTFAKGDTTNAGDYTFTILPNSDGNKGGKTATTAGIVQSDAYTQAINANTGAIVGSALTKSGTLLVKIVRAAKGGLPALTDYENITVTKHDSDDYPNFKILANSAITWSANEQNVSYAISNRPGNISTARYTLNPSGTTAGPTSGASAITVESNTGRIAKTAQGGVVKVKITYPTNAKFEEIVKNVDVTVNKQTSTDTLSVSEVKIPYLSGSIPVANSAFENNLSVTGASGAAQTQKTDWKVNNLATTHGDLTVSGNGKVLRVTGAIPSDDDNTPATVKVIFENDKYKNKLVDVKLTTVAPKLFSTTPTGTTGKWGKAFNVKYNLQTSDVGTTFDPTQHYAFSIVGAGTMPADAPSGLSATTAGIFTSDPIDSKSGAITGTNLLKSGKLLVKIVRTKTGTATVTEYLNITVTKQELGAGKDVTTVPTISLNSGNSKWKTGDTKFDLKYTNLPGGLNANAFAWGIKSTTASGLLEIDTDGKISKATSAGTVVITMSAKSADEKYTGSFDLAAFTITKQTTTDTLSIAQIKVPYSSSSSTVTVSTTTIEGALAVAKGSSSSAQNAQTQASEWKLKTLTEKTDHAKLAVNGKTLTVSGAISTATVTAVFEHPAYDNVTFDFTLSTTAGTMTDDPSTRTGLSGTWGKAFTATDYKLKASDTVGAVTATFKTDGSNDDFTFSVVPSGTAVTGYTSTTANMFTTSPINSKTGAIIGTNLLRGGTLLVKIVRKAKTVPAGTLPALTDYQNITVDKQTLASLTTAPTVTVASGADMVWRSSGGNIPLRYNLPGGTTFTDYDWTVTAVSGKEPDTISSGLAVTGAGVAGAVSGGTVTFKMKAKAGNAKYKGELGLGQFVIKKQTIVSGLTVGNVVEIFDGSVSTVPISENDIWAKVSTRTGAPTKKNDWKIKSLSVPQGTTNLAVDSGGKSLTISGEINTPITVTVTFESKKYVDAQALFRVVTQKGGMYTQIPTGTGKWGQSGQTYTTNYYLDTSLGFTKGTTSQRGNYTFEIVPSGTRVGGFTSTTTGIVQGNGAINPNTGNIVASRLTKGGTLLIKITRDALSSSVPKLVVYQNFTVGKQELGVDRLTSSTVTTDTNEDGKWKTSSSAKIDLKYPSPPTGLQFDWTVARKTGNLPTGTLKIDNNGDISGATSGGTVVTTITAKASDPKYTGKQDFEFTIGKQTTGDNLAFADMRVPQSTAGTDVSFDDLLQQLTVTSGSQTKASEWKVKGVQGSLPANITSGSNKIVVKGAHTDANVTLTLEHPKYNDVNEDIDITTISNPISTGIRTGSGKWGAGQTYSTDYKLKTSLIGSGGSTVTFNKNTDYTFEIAAPSVTPLGYTATTSGIAQSGAIDAKTGAINASKLNKSGTLLVKITRANKGGLGGFEYQNFTVSKQTQADHPNFAVAATSNFRWQSPAQSVTYTETNEPTGISNPVYSLIKAGTTAGTAASNGPGSIFVISGNGKVGGTLASGTVNIKVTYPANDKYETMTLNTQIWVKRRPTPVKAGDFDALDVASSQISSGGGYDIKGYIGGQASQPWGSTFTPTISGKIATQSDGVSGRIDWYTPRYSIKSRTSNGSTPVGGTINAATGVITGTTSSGTLTVEVELPQNVRYVAFGSKTFTVTVQGKTQTAQARSGYRTWDRLRTAVLPTSTDVVITLGTQLENVIGNPKATLLVQSGSTITDGGTVPTDYQMLREVILGRVPSYVTTSDSQAQTEFNAGKRIGIRRGNGGTQRLRAVRLRFKLAMTSDGKYAAKTVDVYWRTR